MSDAMIGALAVVGILLVVSLIGGVRRALIGWGFAVVLIGWLHRVLLGKVTDPRGIHTPQDMRNGAILIVALLGAAITHVLPKRGDQS
jgi:hypothetical protein